MREEVTFGGVARRLVALSLLVILTAGFSAADDTAIQLSLADAAVVLGKRQEAIDDIISKTLDKLASQQAKSGAFDKKTIGTRAEYLALLKKRDEAIVEAGNLLVLQKQLGKSDKQQPLGEWLKDAKPKAVTVSKSNSPPLPEYDYTDIDKYIDAIPKEAESSLETLAEYIKKGAKNDREKARGIARWITNHFAYDYDSVKTGKPNEVPAEVFKLRAAACGGHSSVFQTLGKGCGLEVLLVNGTARRAVTNPTFAKFSKETASGQSYEAHSWNAVKIEGNWYIQDVTWQNGRAKRDNTIEIDRETGWDWFLVPPEHAIHTHLPKDANEEFLTEPIDRQSHEHLPFVYPNVFAYGIKPISHTGPVVVAQDEAILKFEVPKGIDFFASLYLDAKKLPDEHVVKSRDGSIVSLRVLFPKKGVYDLRIAAKPVKSTMKVLPKTMEYRAVALGGKEPSPRPTLYSKADENGVEVLLPRAVKFKSGEKVQFLVRLPKATGAMVLCKEANKRTTLTGKDGYFAGTVTVTEGEVQVMAKYEGDARFWGVVGFKAE